MKWMNLHHLKYFLVIAEEGSIAAASKKLLIGQPALSAQLKQFEESLGAPLFNREKQRLILNETGEYVLKYARAIREIEDELITNMESGIRTPSRVITVGGQESVPKSILVTAIKALKQKEDVEIHVIEGTGAELFELLLKGKIDVFVGNFKPLSEGREMIYKSLGKESVSVWGSKKYSPLRARFPESLDQKKFILPGFQNPLRHDFERFMLQSGLTFKVGVEAQDTALLKELAASDEGLVVLADESARAWAKSGRLIKIGNLPEVREEFWIGMVKRSIDNKQLKAILSSLA